MNSYLEELPDVTRYIANNSHRSLDDHEDEFEKYLRVIRRGGVTGAARLARHLWRMCFALFVASGSLFLGQPQVFPAPLRNSPLLIGMAVAPLGFLIFWIIRVRLKRLSLPRDRSLPLQPAPLQPAPLQPAE